jgi:hypothetical protein
MAQNEESKPNRVPVPKLELLKLSFDWCKHIATLSTGSILLMVTFRDKLATQSGQSDSRIFLPIALAGFFAAILGTLGIQLEHLRQEKYDVPSLLGKVSMTLVVGGFLVGIICLSSFGIMNLL